MGRLNTELQRQGFNSLERIYLLFVDTNVYCGVGSWWSDDSPDPNVNNNNVGRSYARVDNGCWAGWIAAHEVMHNLGGPGLGSPGKGAHCIDEWDIMCYSDSPYYPSMQTICPSTSLNRSILDCNHDDYFNTNPAPGSYLATYWNPANNRFLTNAVLPPPPVPAPAPAPVPATTIDPAPPDGSTDTGGQNNHKKKHKKRR